MQKNDKTSLEKFMNYKIQCNHYYNDKGSNDIGSFFK